MVSGKFYGEASGGCGSAAKHTAVQPNAGIVKHLPFIVDDRAAERVVAHQVNEIVQKRRFGGRHDNAERLLSREALGRTYLDQGTRVRSSRRIAGPDPARVRALDEKLNNRLRRLRRNGA